MSVQTEITEESARCQGLRLACLPAVRDALIQYRPPAPSGAKAAWGAGGTDGLKAVPFKVWLDQNVPSRTLMARNSPGKGEKPRAAAFWACGGLRTEDCELLDLHHF